MTKSATQARQWQWLFMIMSLVIISGCMESDQPFMKGREPEIVTKDFFEAIYNERDLEAAQKISSDSLASLLGSYGTVNGVQRHLLNRYYDNVDITIDTTSMRPFMDRQDSMRINVLMTGEYDGDMLDELRSVKIIQVNDRWYVDEILDDPYK
ncbi:hypothetical protein SAMN06297229_1115 [Pseudidiomarina planktonica]|uniref:DUF3828 domain-containing protein n=1 Tax=Pseudidiomarina planktonica TaxID=1323738 RepID=A0A1Y6EX28_9GAMM|nr:hypothetical protein [Pseudidiomarina planktonica]RUO65476.1 hypothetical protein CWI77_03190 [Pseudidiomarina planktonica]SMQ64833.1 hypothetical protein SAMN06297229_1115 [Pseudidiomarina planktonica]